MGQSTNAIMFYGYCWDDEITLIEDDWEEVLMEKRGIINPWKEHDNTADWADRNRTRLNEWEAEKSKVIEEFGVKFDTHCSGDCPMPYLAIPSTVLLATRGNPETFEPTVMMGRIEWKGHLDKWLKEFDITPPQKEPQWWLVSDWN